MPPPIPPRELVYALRVSVADLRPWEYKAMDSEEYELILGARNAYENGRRKAQERAEQMAAMQRKMADDRKGKPQ